MSAFPISRNVSALATAELDRNMVAGKRSIVFMSGPLPN